MPDHDEKPAGGELSLSDDWRVWVVDNLLGGSSPPDLIATLVANGVPEAVAEPEVTAIASSPALTACKRYTRDLDRLQQIARLRSTMARFSSVPEAVPRRAGVEAEEFYDTYYAGNLPVVLTDVMTRWPAYSRWSPGYFKDKVGAAEVEVTVGRESDPDYDMNFAKHSTTMSMAELVDRVVAAGESNDLYLTSNNRNMRRESLQVLLDDVEVDPSFFDPETLARFSALWFGPAGTRTPLHHDGSNILFCQVVGRKRVFLIDPSETAMLSSARGVYNRFDCEHPDFERCPELADVLVKSVDLAAGEALFIPAGWWHQVRALELSITLSLMAFRRPNDFSWYKPGSRR